MTATIATLAVMLLQLRILFTIGAGGTGGALAASNAKHTIVQRTAKWLIAAVHRTGSQEFEMTREQLAALLGVGRTFVTRTVSRLRAEGYIETRRGVFVVRDEAGLGRLSCHCAPAIEEHYDTVMHGIYPPG